MTVRPCSLRHNRRMRLPRPSGRTRRVRLPSATFCGKGRRSSFRLRRSRWARRAPRITSHIALPGRFLVYMPTVDHIGVSRKIPSDEERSRLKRVLQSNRTGISGGYIVRTAGEGRTEEELRADMMFLYNMWLDIFSAAEGRAEARAVADPEQ